MGRTREPRSPQPATAADLALTVAAALPPGGGPGRYRPASRERGDASLPARQACAQLSLHRLSFLLVRGAHRVRVLVRGRMVGVPEGAQVLGGERDCGDGLALAAGAQR